MYSSVGLGSLNTTKICVFPGIKVEIKKEETEEILFQFVCRCVKSFKRILQKHDPKQQLQLQMSKIKTPAVAAGAAQQRVMQKEDGQPHYTELLTRHSTITRYGVKQRLESCNDVTL